MSASCRNMQAVAAIYHRRIIRFGLLLAPLSIIQAMVFLEGAENLVPELLSEYFPIAVFFAIAVGLAIAMVSASLLLGNQRPDDEKMAAYECGFDAFDDSRRQFDVRFYLVAILFIIFDLEVAFLFPWAVSLGGIGVFGFWSMMLFLAVLTVGFIYEWKKGALEWE